MQNNRYLYTVGSAVFLTAELAFLLAIQLANGMLHHLLCVSSIALAFVFVAAFGKRSRDGLLVLLSLGCTLVADAILQFSDPIQRLPAMLFFSAAQILYALLLLSWHPAGRRGRHFALYGVVAAAALSLTGAVLGENTDAVSLISLFYYATLAVNIISAFRTHRTLTFAFGLVFFILCDTLVGLDVMILEYIPLSPDNLFYRLTHTGIDLAWLFYVPAQTLIALSAAGRHFHASAAEKCKF